MKARADMEDCGSSDVHEIISAEEDGEGSGQEDEGEAEIADEMQSVNGPGTSTTPSSVGPAFPTVHKIPSENKAEGEDNLKF